MATDLNLGPIPPFDTRGVTEKRYVLESFRRPFSGFLGGIHKGGYWVERLSDEWRGTFGCKYAVPCNSATSGLLAACIAAGVGPGDTVWAPVYTMSATAACAKILGANVELIDIEPKYFSLDMMAPGSSPKPKAIIVTNLFGHPAVYLKEMRRWCDHAGVVLIEDNAQAPFAKFEEDYTGTIGHMGVFSLNVHKHIQVGEGGVVVTDDHGYQIGVFDAINHGENRYGPTGLNLRMTEPTAAMACAQLAKAPWIIKSRRDLALEFTDMVKDIPQIHPPKERSGCTHVYYIWAAKLWVWDRKLFVERLNRFGIPMNEGYSPLLSTLFKTNGNFPVAGNLEDKELITFDICSWSPRKRQIRKMYEVFNRVADSFK